MSDINFVIPCTKEDLLHDSADKYYVKDIVVPRDLQTKLRG